MRVIRNKSRLRAALTPLRVPGRTIALIPTMGYLHDGHRSLLRAARAECDTVVMSLFVNPSQFRPGEDLERYPRDEGGDFATAESEGVDLIYAPGTDQVYGSGFATSVEVGPGLTEVLCGDAERRGPEHFRGVTTIVAKLFNTVEPDVAYFGQKDAQQAIVIRRMADDLDFPVRIAVLPTVREPDGLAMSSRNAHLSDDERDRALALARALGAAETRASDGASLDDAISTATAELQRAGVDLEYLEARDAGNLERAQSFNGRPILIAVAARVGNTRLIDNVVIGGR